MLGVSESRIAGSQGPDFSVPRLHLNFKCLPLNILTAIEAKHRASYFNEWHFGIAGSGEPLKDISTSNAPKCRALCLKVNFLGVIEIPRPFRSGWDKGRGKWGSDLATFLCVIFAIFYRKIPKLVMPIPSIEERLRKNQMTGWLATLADFIPAIKPNLRHFSSPTLFSVSFGLCS